MNLFGIFTFALLAQGAQADMIWDVNAGREVQRADLEVALSKAGQVVLGEKHYSAPVQAEEAALFKTFAESRRSAVTLAWEFLNWSDHQTTQQLYKSFSQGLIDSTAFIEGVFGPKAPEIGYAPLFDALKKEGGYLLETNLSRAEKAPVVSNGLTALDPALLPPGFQLGSDLYLERFTDAMGGHVSDPAKMKNYFAAQCLVDDVIAYHISKDAQGDGTFLVIGNFHTQYGEGVVARLRARTPTQTQLVIQVSEASEYPEATRSDAFHSARYGKIADYVILKD